MTAATSTAYQGKKDMSYYFIVTISLTGDAHTPYDAYVREIKAHC